MIVWINGAFGAGKSTVAAQVRSQLPAARHFDPEYVGFVLSRFRPVPTGDFQDLPQWRSWVVRLGRLLARGGRPVVVPMTLIRTDYRAAVLGGLRERGVPVRQVVLRVPEPLLRARIDGDRTLPEESRRWRHDHVAPALAALTGLADREPETIEVDNYDRSPAAVAAEIVSSLPVASADPGR